MKHKLAFLLLALVLAPASALADTVTFTGVNGVHDNQYYVSPYYGTLNGSPVTLFCIDIMNTVRTGQTWQANLSTITPGSDLSDTRYGGLTGALTLYQQAAWLTTQFATHPNDYINLQYALWNLFNPSVSPDTAGSNAWLALAAANFSSLNYNGFFVVTNVAPLMLSGRGQVQEFIIYLPPPLTPVPEPATLALFGTGLLGMATVLRSRLLR